MAVALADSLLVAPPRPLPTYPADGGSPSVQASGQSTIKTDPPPPPLPSFAVASAAHIWQDYGDATFTHIMTVHGNHNQLTTEFLFEREPAMYHSSEGNVVRSSAIHLLHPVNQALSLWSGDGVLCKSESATNKIRSDITYHRGNRAFVVVEFKEARRD